MKKVVIIAAAVLALSGCVTTAGTSLVEQGYTLNSEKNIHTSPRRNATPKKRCTYTNGTDKQSVIVTRGMTCAK